MHSVFSHMQCSICVTVCPNNGYLRLMQVLNFHITDYVVFPCGNVKRICYKHKHIYKHKFKILIFLSLYRGGGRAHDPFLKLKSHAFSISFDLCFSNICFCHVVVASFSCFNTKESTKGSNLIC